MRKQCITCKGEYEDKRKNRLYFHSCPPTMLNPQGKSIPRPQRRDENIKMLETVKDMPKNTLRGATWNPRKSIKSEGQGTKDL